MKHEWSRDIESGVFESIGDVIGYLRRSTGHDYPGLARFLGYSASQAQWLEKVEQARSPPSVNLIARLAYAFDLRLEHLIHIDADDISFRTMRLRLDRRAGLVRVALDNAMRSPRS